MTAPFPTCSCPVQLCDPDSSRPLDSLDYVSDFVRSVGHDPLIVVGVRLLTPAVREIYAILLQAGILVVDD
jgi:hypothetical protein